MGAGRGGLKRGVLGGGRKRGKKGGFSRGGWQVKALRFSRVGNLTPICLIIRGPGGAPNMGFWADFGGIFRGFLAIFG